MINFEHVPNGIRLDEFQVSLDRVLYESGWKLMEDQLPYSHSGWIGVLMPETFSHSWYTPASLLKTAF